MDSIGLPLFYQTGREIRHLMYGNLKTLCAPEFYSYSFPAPSERVRAAFVGASKRTLLYPRLYFALCVIP